MLNSVHMLGLKKLWRSVAVNLMDATLGLISHHPREELVEEQEAIEAVEEEAVVVIEVPEIPAPRKESALEDAEPEAKKEALSQHQIRTKTIPVNLPIDNDNNFAIIYLYIFIFDV